ncbi:MAG: Asp-tRNA(Asn)/Glu-tRNA(Gln) amidotransferase subunit GatB [Planctomycetota bacterium]|nr:MAG: Asp-tRNA(Asn)/Glu-tRNA(Gln) amidotransferase subunit GatB [Planctomycetota bacterium]
MSGALGFENVLTGVRPVLPSTACVARAAAQTGMDRALMFRIDVRTIVALRVEACVADFRDRIARMSATHATAKILRTELKVGLEIHIELATRSKMFTRAPNPAHPDFYDCAPNSLVDPVVMALPGSLPVMNLIAVEMSMQVGMALGCEIASFSKWDRKNYFYPDLPKAYQISQYDLPLCINGSVEIPVSAGGSRSIGIIRAHLEEDTGKLSHELPGGVAYAGSLVDLNRAGTPLLEVVTAPDFDCADDVVTFGQELRNICRFLGVTGGIMQRGHMRFEPNVNVLLTLEDGSVVKTPIVEIKNLNSFKAVKGAIEFETKRQVEEWRVTGRVMGKGMKITRGWDDLKGQTFVQREKEDAHDYRYFPDPDLVPVVVDDAWRARVRATLPELPMARRARYREQFRLSEVDARVLTDDADFCAFYESCVAATTAKGCFKAITDAGYATGKMLLNAGSKRANERNCMVQELGIDANQVADVLALREDGTVGPQAADLLFGFLCDTKDNAATVAEQQGLVQVRDESALEAWCDQAIAANPQPAADVRAGKVAAIGRLVGAVMKLSAGKAEAQSVNDMLRKRLS